MKHTGQKPTRIINDAPQMRDVFTAKLADAQREHDETGMKVYGDCVRYWSQKAEAVTL